MAKRKTDRNDAEEQLEAQALNDYDYYRGKVIEVGSISGYDDSDNSLDVKLHPPAIVRVLGTPKGDIVRWMDDDHLDPVYNVDLVVPHPQLEGMRSFWIYGESRSLRGEPCESDILRVVPFGRLRYMFQENL
jgi:hypothetical protein